MTITDLFARPEWLWLLAAAPAAALAAGWAATIRGKALRRLIGATSAWRLVPGHWPAGRVWRVTLSLAGGCCLVVAFARPQWGERSEPIVRRGVDIVLALDTSRSMACEDVRPSRFERARLAVGDLLRRRSGDRVALMPFSRDAAVNCPLTLDYGAVRLFLDAAEVAPAGAAGTDMEQAIRAALGTFEKGERKFKVIVLLTDGEDHGGDAADAARRAREEGVSIYALGIGAPAGGPIPLRDERGNPDGYLRDRDGRVVTTRLDLALLQKVCDAGGGRAYQLGGTGAEVGSLSDEIDGLEKKEQKGTLASRREERYRWPLAAAIVLFTGEALVPRLLRGRNGSARRERVA
ncbi:MAG: VWA domain-containing protein [Thermoanaerobaculia bacterium]